jgi:pseudaminic acid synthase
MSRLIQVAGRRIGVGYPPYVIAEISGNHKGDIKRAIRLIDAAKAAGADAVKLQTYTADTITINHDGPGFVIDGGLWHGRRLYELYEEAHTPWAWHAELFAAAADRRITCFSSPFDPSAVDFLEKLGAPAYKIASFEIVDLPLIRHVASTKKPMIISTGMASQDEVAEALAAARGAGAVDVVLLHCVSGYPTPASEANLARIAALSRMHGCSVGLSDHTLGTDVAVAATALGAVVIEKHVTLARADGGPDAEFSLEPHEFASLVRSVRNAFDALGAENFGQTDCERGSRLLRRSLYAVADIAEGSQLTLQNVRSIRPGYGLPPKHLPEILGRRAKQAIARGTPLTKDMFD